MQHFDPAMIPFVESIPKERIPQPKLFRAHELFHRLADDVIGQQLSGKVARVLSNRFQLLFEDGNATSEKIIALDPEDLRAVGMSWSKVRTLRELAEHSENGHIPWNEFEQMSDTEIASTLLPVWGIGQWTVDMFLLFTLARTDVFSPNDLGLKKGIQKVYQLEKMPTPQEAAALAENWCPQRSLASLALWWSLEA